LIFAVIVAYFEKSTDFADFTDFFFRGSITDNRLPITGS